MEKKEYLCGCFIHPTNYPVLLVPTVPCSLLFTSRFLQNYSFFKILEKKMIFTNIYQYEEHHFLKANKLVLSNSCKQSNRT